jgi:hypothetical protein
MLAPMGDILKLIWWTVIGLFRSRSSLEAEILTLRHQLNVLRRKSPKRLAFSNFDRLIFAGLYRIAPRIVNALVIIEPETVIRWHRAGFRSFWRWKSRCRGGRPKVALEIRQLIRAMSLANPLWGAPRIHGELLKLGIDVGQTSVAKYMARHRRPPSQGWKAFLRNHADGIASMDLFVVPTLSFRLLYGLLILRHGRRQILWLGVTAQAFIQINDLDAVDSLIVSWVDPVTISLVGSATNSIVVPGSITIDPVENNTGLWPLVSTSGLTIFGRFGQQFSIYYG